MSASSQIKARGASVMAFSGRLPRRQWRPLATLADRVFASDSTVRRRRGFRHYFSVLGDFKGFRGGKFPPRTSSVAEEASGWRRISAPGPVVGTEIGHEETVAHIVTIRKKNQHTPFRKNDTLALRVDATIIGRPLSRSCRSPCQTTNQTRWRARKKRRTESENSRAGYAVASSAARDTSPEPSTWPSR